MRGLAFGARCVLFGLCVGLATGCAARADKRLGGKALYAVPEGTTVTLKEPCKLAKDGKTAKDCKFLMQIHFIKAL